MKEQKDAKIPIWRSMQMKFAISYLVLMLAAFVLVYTYPIITAQNLVFQTKQTALQSQASLISSTLSSQEVLTAESVSQVMELLDGGGMTRIIIVDTDGLILYDTEDHEEAVHYALLQELTLALNGKDVFYSSYDDGVLRSTAATPVMYRNATIGAVYLYEYSTEQGTLINGLSQDLFRISIVVLGLALLISLLLSRTMTHRISRLIAGISRLQAGEYSTRIETSGRDELVTLANAFNDLTERLETTDEVRKRFVSDASHELKTPLASIKLLTDSIAQNPDMDLETVREFVSDIGSEADRLNRITEKLLALTRMDNGSFAQRVRVDLADVVTDALHMLTPLAGEKNISIHLEMEEGCIVLSSPDEMYQVVFNLVENAIKYNVPEGKIRINLNCQEQKVLLSVADTGIGIPREEKDKIFDRFYRVDKARSREAGGTGLGLSIVRDTVHLNGGNIRVEDQDGGGSRFTVTLPLAVENGGGEG